jgi:hypothetical protein
MPHNFSQPVPHPGGEEPPAATPARFPVHVDRDLGPVLSAHAERPSRSRAASDSAKEPPDGADALA